ncbi:MAG: hypothetical protein ACO3SE_09025 [Sedimenticolaceae bacterium]
MIDPITAFTVATTAFNTIKKAVEVGREIEDVAGYLGKFFGAKADIAKAEEKAKNPPIFRKLLSAGSVEEEALQIVVQRQKLMQMEKELRSMIILRYGQEVYLEMMRQRERIAVERRRAEYVQSQKRKHLMLNVALGAMVLLCLWGLTELIWLLMEMVRARNA